MRTPTLSALLKEHEINMPTENGWYIFLFTDNSFYVEGDERSRTNPGHGYPAHTVHNRDVKIYYYSTLEEIEKVLKMLWEEKPRKSIFACQVSKTIQMIQTFSANIVG